MTYWPDTSVIRRGTTYSTCVFNFLRSLVSVHCVITDIPPVRPRPVESPSHVLIGRVVAVTAGRALDAAVIYLPDSDALFDRRGAQSPGPARLCGGQMFFERRTVCRRRLCAPGSAPDMLHRLSGQTGPQIVPSAGTESVAAVAGGGDGQ